MAKWILIMGMLLMTACGNKGSDSNNNNTNVPQTGNNTASTPLDTACLQNASNCNNNVYNQYYQYGWAAYPNYNYQSQNGYYRFCSCPYGTMPAYNGNIGMGCVNANAVPQAYFQWQFKWKKNGDRRFLQYSYYGHGRYTTQPSRNQNCYNNVAQSCFVDQANSCANGGYCQATGGSRLGVCINRVSNGSGGR